jgi:hypothetical protein
LDVESGALDLRTWKEYEDYDERLIRVFGENAFVQDLGPDNFLKLKTDLQKTHKSLVSLKGDNAVQGPSKGLTDALKMFTLNTIEHFRRFFA